MQALSLLFLTLTALGKKSLLQLLHFASGSFGLQPRIIRFHADRSQHLLSGQPPQSNAHANA
jgi:hypothetical protein